MINVREHSLLIRTVGPGYGESILLSIGDVFKIGIDVNKYLNYSIENRKSILTNFLAGNKIDHWVITHFHLDHFQGLSKIIKDEVSLKMLIPDDYLIEDFRALLFNDTKQNSSSKLSANEALSEYDQIKKLVKQLGYKVTSLGSGKINIVKEIVVDANKLECELEINVYAMTNKESSSIKSKSIKAISNHHTSTKSSGRIINTTSLIVSLKYGQFNGLYLADAPISRINNFLRESGNQSFNFVKIGHHGSNSSTNKTLLSKINKATTLFAVVTPFNKSKLPDPKVLKLYINEGYIVEVTSTSFLNPEIVESLEKHWKDPTGSDINNIEITEAFNIADCIIDYKVIESDIVDKFN